MTGGDGTEAGPAVASQREDGAQAAAGGGAAQAEGADREGTPAPEPPAGDERPADVEPFQADPASAGDATLKAEKPRRRRKKAPAGLNGASGGPGRDTAAAGHAPAEAADPIDYGGLSLEGVLESLLFVADGAVPLAHLAEALGVHPRDVDAALNRLAETYLQRGLSLQRFRDRVQLTTAPAAAAVVERFLGLAAMTPLSRAALETLAIIAYQQPVTRPQIEAVRGVNSDSVIKNLLTKGLVEESGRAEGPGRPVLYSTTSEFMQHFGLASLTDLPPLALPGTAADASAPVSHEQILKG